MRLAQLARKLLIRPSEIVDFLTERGIQIEDGLNTRLEDNHVGLIMQKFAPARAAEVAAELVIEKAEELKVETEKVPEVKSEITEEVHSQEVTSSENEGSEKPELIKAPKVELSGLKVLGKIELPQPKKKETPISNDEIVGDPQPTEEGVKEETKETPQRNPERRKENRKPYLNKRESSERPKVNPIAAQREREALEAERKRRAKVKEEKEKRTQHYLKKVKVVGPTKSAKLVQEEFEEMTPLAPVPTSWWEKFKRWLNT